MTKGLRLIKSEKVTTKESNEDFANMITDIKVLLSDDPEYGHFVRALIYHGEGDYASVSYKLKDASNDLQGLVRWSNRVSLTSQQQSVINRLKPIVAKIDALSRECANFKASGRRVLSLVPNLVGKLKIITQDLLTVIREGEQFYS